MWMHFHGQMSTQPSQRMHSAWSMWRNCFGFTDCGQVRRVDFLELVVDREVGHGRVGIGACHQRHRRPLGAGRGLGAGAGAAAQRAAEARPLRGVSSAGGFLRRRRCASATSTNSEDVEPEQRRRRCMRDDDVAQRRVVDVERPVHGKNEHVLAAAEHEVRGAPLQVLVGEREPLVRDDAVRERHQREHADRASHALGPRRGPVRLGPAHEDEDDDQSDHGSSANDPRSIRPCGSHPWQPVRDQVGHRARCPPAKTQGWERSRGGFLSRYLSVVPIVGS